MWLLCQRLFLWDPEALVPQATLDLCLLLEFDSAKLDDSLFGFFVHGVIIEIEVIVSTII
jgi:hypothetical protein